MDFKRCDVFFKFKFRKHLNKKKNKELNEINDVILQVRQREPHATICDPPVCINYAVSLHQHSTTSNFYLFINLIIIIMLQFFQLWTKS